MIQTQAQKNEKARWDQIFSKIDSKTATRKPVHEFLTNEGVIYPKEASN